jgi:biopolymer transport protein ExbD
MNLRGERPDEIEINITSLIDVVFILLLFFVVTTTFAVHSKIELTLPQASDQNTEQAVDVIEVAVDRSGQYFINGNRLSDGQPATIQQALAAAKAGIDEPTVIISADESATHQAVIDVMDAARQVGLYRITFPTRARDED